MSAYATLRKNMIDGQIRTNGVINEALIDVLNSVPREEFVPANVRDVAYCDEDISIGHGRYLLQPMNFAKMLQAVGVTANDGVLIVGSGTGYGLAVVSAIAQYAVGVEENAELAQESVRTLSRFNVQNVKIESGRHVNGMPDHAPYDVIIVEGGAMAAFPEVLAAQLKDNGRAVYIERDPKATTAQAIMLQKLDDNTWSRRVLFDCHAEFLTGFGPSQRFVL